MIQISYGLHRVTDVDDLILNLLGFLIGYALYVCVKKVKISNAK